MPFYALIVVYLLNSLGEEYDFKLLGVYRIRLVWMTLENVININTECGIKFHWFEENNLGKLNVMNIAVKTKYTRLIFTCV